MDIKTRVKSAAELLQQIIAIPSLTFSEEGVADFVYGYLTNRCKECGAELKIERFKNNIALYLSSKVEGARSVMFAAHLDTVPPSEGYSRDPYTSYCEEDKIYGLGSNDDGGSVVSMIETFFYFAQSGTSPVNIILALTAEEERSGADGIELLLPNLDYRPDYVIVGEPTQMKAAVAERGLLVLDCEAVGVSGHAARGEGVNALYIALEDIAKLRDYKFDRVSPMMGEVRLTVTQLECGTQHNVIPDRAHFVVDIRPTELYTNSEIVDILQHEVKSRLIPRNLKNRASATPSNGVLMSVINSLGVESYISPTTSDWVRLPGYEAVKMGAGDSARSHRADEYITLGEIEVAIEGYIKFVENIK
ncbi:MAG: M20/M25/M40 family metallo-hydrolase [Rikenellaceae bacterium]